MTRLFSTLALAALLLGAWFDHAPARLLDAALHHESTPSGILDRVSTAARDDDTPDDLPPIAARYGAAARDGMRRVARTRHAQRDGGARRRPGAVTAHYVAHSLTLPPGAVLVAESVARSIPRTIALGANGSVAAIVTNGGTPARARRIVVWRRDGSRVIIGMPSDAVLHESLRQYAEGPTGYPYAAFAHIVLASDGTPFATVESQFSGAYSGIGKAVVRWTGTAWKIVRPHDTPQDLDVVAVESQPLRIGLTGDFSSGFLTYDEVARDPEFQRPLSLSYDGHAARRLGTGTLTGLAGAYACGFIGEENGMIMPDNVNVEGQTPYALLWHGGTTRRLGRGLAFGVNAGGVAVGDDRATVERAPQATGMPMRWDAQGAHELGRQTGTAFAIAQDGTFVGTFSYGAGFVGRGITLTSLNVLVPAAHISGAYAINGRGRILVLTESRSRGTPGLAYLDPRPSPPGI